MIYIIECYNPIIKKYYKVWEGDNQVEADKMYDKPYYKKHSRRMLRVEELSKDKGEK